MRQLKWINIIYVIFWGIVSFISSFIGVLNLEWRIFTNGDLLLDIFNPLFIWIIAFFGEYIYIISTYNVETHKLDENWTIMSFIFTFCLFVLFLLSIHIMESYRIFCVLSIYICMMGLKTASLYVLCPRQPIQSMF